MPVYVYRCQNCGVQIEKRQSFSEAPLIECESCHGVLRKVFLPAPIIFKGSGFYSTDHRSKAGGESRNGGSDNGDAAKAVPAGGSEASKDAGKAKDAGATKDAGTAAAAAAAD